MTDLQEKALKTAKEHVNRAYMLILREGTTPAEASRTNTHSHAVIEELSTAERWLDLVIEDNSNNG